MQGSQKIALGFYNMGSFGQSPSVNRARFKIEKASHYIHGYCCLTIPYSRILSSILSRLDCINGSLLIVAYEAFIGYSTEDL